MAAGVEEPVYDKQESDMREPSLYPRVLGSAWQDVADVIQRAHRSTGGLQACGIFQFVRGNNGLARFLARLLRLPAETDATDVRVEVIPDRGGEQWRRRFGRRCFVTRQRQGPPGVLVERVSILEFHFRLTVNNGGLSYRQTAAGLRVGPVYVPFPQWMRPEVTAREEPDDRPDHISVRVTVSLPLVGLLMKYGGRMELRERER